MTTDRNGREHHAAGAPASTGGQYARQPTPGAASTLTLERDTTPMSPYEPIAMPEKLRDGRATVLDAGMRELKDGVMRRLEMRQGGYGPEREANRLVAASYDREAALATLDEIGSGQVSMLALNSIGDIDIFQGNLAHDGQTLLAKGSSTKGYPVHEHSKLRQHIIAASKGYKSGQALLDDLAQRRSEHAPKLVDVDPAALPHEDETEAARGDGSEGVAAVYVFTHPGLPGDEPVEGCLYFATDRTPGTPDGAPHTSDAINGFLVAPDGSYLTNEIGSFYAHQLKAWGGAVADYEPGAIAFGDVVREHMSVQGSETDTRALLKEVLRTSREARG